MAIDGQESDGQESLDSLDSFSARLESLSRAFNPVLNAKVPGCSMGMASLVVLARCLTSCSRTRFLLKILSSLGNVPGYPTSIKSRIALRPIVVIR